MRPTLDITRISAERSFLSGAVGIIVLHPFRSILIAEKFDLFAAAGREVVGKMVTFDSLL